jgi:hypothetical protein
MAVVDPLPHHETPQPPANPTIQIPQVRPRLDQMKTTDPSAQVHLKIHDDPLGRDAPQSPRDLSDAIPETLQGPFFQRDLEKLSRGKNRIPGSLAHGIGIGPLHFSHGSPPASAS